jgi:hypothetical protein
MCLLLDKGEVGELHTSSNFPTADLRTVDASGLRDSQPNKGRIFQCSCSHPHSNGLGI